MSSHSNLYARSNGNISETWDDTVDAAVNPFHHIHVAENEAGILFVQLHSTNKTTLNTATRIKRIAYKRVGAGAVTFDNPTNEFTRSDTGMTGVDVNPSVSGGVLKLDVNGVTGQQIRHKLTIQLDNNIVPPQ